MIGCLLPLISLVATCVMFLSDVEHRKQAQRLYLLTLVLVLFCTAITVIACDDCWLIHTTTLGMMVIAAFLVPTAEPKPVHAARTSGFRSAGSDIAGSDIAGAPVARAGLDRGPQSLG